jgi:hypothetical protein
MQKGDWLGVVIVVVLLGGVAAFLAWAPDAPISVYAPVEVTGSSVTVGAQAGEESVRVSAEVKRNSFVTVHKAIGDAPGPIVGASALLTPGTHAPLTIELNEPLVPLDAYFILMFLDDGDGVYESGIDLPIMSEGQVIKEKLSL